MSLTCRHDSIAPRRRGVSVACAISTISSVALLALLALAAVACSGERPQVWQQPQGVVGPLVIGEQVVWLDRARGLLFALDADPAAPRVHQIPVGRNAGFATLTPDRKQLVVLTAGREAITREQRDEPPTLHVINAGVRGVAPSVARAYRLAAPFDRLALSTDGRWAVAFFDGANSAGGAQSGDVFRNPNEVALLDLSAAPSADNPLSRTLRSFGSAPLAVTFSPPTEVPVGGRTRTLALVLSRGYVTFLEMDSRTRREITVPLSPSDSQTTVEPRQVIFAGQTVYIRADGAEDLYAIALEPATPSGQDGNDYSPRINQPSAGRQALDLLLVDGATAGTPGKRLILTVNAENDLALIDADTSQFSRIALGEPVDTIVAVPPVKGGANPTRHFALLYNRRAPRSRIHFVQLDNLATALGANVRSRTTAQPVREVLVAPGGERALIVHDDARAVVSLVDLVGENRTDTPIAGTLPLRSFGFVGEGQLVGVAPGLMRLGVLDLVSLHPVNVRLDHAPQRVLVAGNTIVVDHGSAAGMVTLLRSADASAGDREAGRVVWGFLLDKLLDSELED